MKVIIIFIMTLLLCSIVAFATDSTNESDYLFYDDAETGTFGTKWGFRLGSTGDYTTDASYNGTKSISVTPAGAIYHTLPSLTNVVVDYQFYVPSADVSGGLQAQAYTGQYGTANAWGNALQGGTSTTHYSYFIYGSGWFASSQTYVDGWVHGKIIYNSSHVTTMMKDVVTYQDPTPYSTPTTKDIILYHNGGSGKIFLDNVRAWNYTLYGIDPPQEPEPVIVYDVSATVFNSTSANITTLNELQEFNIRTNYSENSIPLDNATCEFRQPLGEALVIRIPFKSDADNFTLNGSNQKELNLYANSSQPSLDSYQTRLCREDSAYHDIDILLQGAIATTLSGDRIPLCENGYYMLYARNYSGGTSTYSGVQNINVTVQCPTCSATERVRMVKGTIDTILRFDRRYGNISIPLLYNSSTSLYESRGDYFYEGQGTPKLNITCNEQNVQIGVSVLTTNPIPHLTTIIDIASEKAFINNTVTAKGDTSFLGDCEPELDYAAQPWTFNISYHNGTFITSITDNPATINMSQLNVDGLYDVEFTCFDNEVNFSSIVKSFNVTSSVPPITINASINPYLYASTMDTLNGNCQVNDSDSDVLTYEWEWFNNSVSVSSGSFGDAPNTTINLANISASLTNIDDSWTFSCRGNDSYTFSDWLNSTPTNLTAVVYTNLSTTSINYPVLSWSTYVNLTGAWNGNADCQMIDNVSWVSCIPTISNINLSNSTSFLCTASEPNTGDVNVYAQCNSSTELLRNSTAYVYSIDADANPDQTTNLSGTITDYMLSGFDVLITETNWNEQAICGLVFNDTGLTCNSTLINSSSNGVISCSGDYLQEKSYNVSTNCNGSIYININSTLSQTFNFDSNSNPAISANFTNLTLTQGQTYNILINATDYYENTTNCAVIWDNATANTCNDFNITANQSDTSYATITCTEEHAEAEFHTVSVQCNSTNYPRINSTIYTVYHDSLFPDLMLINSSYTNTTWKYVQDSFTFASTCYHPAPTNLSFFNVTCYNQTDDVVFSDTNSIVVDNYTYSNITNTFNYPNKFLCEYSCSDGNGHTTRNYSNISSIEINITKSNISSFNQTDSDFMINAPFNLNGDNAQCILTPNTTSISCASYTGTTPALFNCTFAVGVEENVTFNMTCNDTTRSFINNTQSSTSVAIFIDSVDPSITALNWTANKTYFRQNITGQFRFRDNSSLYRWNVTIDGKSIDSAVNPSYLTYIYNLSYDPSLLASGNHILFIQIADGHTSKEIPDYKVKLGSLFDNSDVKFTTPKGNIIEISADDKNIDDVFSISKEKDKYTFTYQPFSDPTRTDITVEKIKDGKVIVDKDKDKDKDDKDNTSKEYIKIKFKVKCSNDISIMQKNNTVWQKWLVCGDNWIDFMGDNMENSLVNFQYDYGSEQPYKNIKVEVYYNGSIYDPIKFKSVGDLNIVNYTTSFYTVNATVTYTSPVSEQTDNLHNLYINISGTPITFDNITAVLTYNGTKYTPSKTGSASYINWVKTVTSPNSTNDSVVPFIWNITMIGEPSYLWYFNQSIFFVDISQNCTQAGYVQAIEFCGYQESFPELNISDMKLNINLNLLTDDGTETVKQFGFEFDNATCYQLCIYPNTTTYQIDAKMEYGDGNYTDRKYYIVNSTLSNVSSTINLYHLESDLSSDVVLTTYDKNTGTRIENAYIKILRYYPGLDNSSSASYRTVEVEQTDVNGQTLGKMVLADVWYKFIVEYPAGTVILNTDIEKIITLDKLLPVSLSTGNLLDYNELLGISADVDCSWLVSPPSCTFTWSTSDGTDITGYLKIYQDTGFTKITVYNDSITSSAASITHQITGNTTNKKYIAEGWVSR